MGDYKAALEKITDVLRRRKMSYPDFHPTIAECFYIAAECTRQLGNPKMAQKYYDEAADIRKKVISHPLPTITCTLYNLYPLTHPCPCSTLLSLSTLSIAVSRDAYHH